MHAACGCLWCQSWTFMRRGPWIIYIYIRLFSHKLLDNVEAQPGRICEM